MQFYSTHGQCRLASLEEAVMTGLAPDGGLYMPERIPVIPRAFFNNIGEMSVSDIAYVVATTMLGDDIEPSELKDIVFDTFSFDIPLKEIESGVYARPWHSRMSAPASLHGLSATIPSLVARKSTFSLPHPGIQVAL